ncbi:MAG: arylamine N-acetyltransferase [Anaerolineae bacterium]|nr:arylamine N-acetyltransferase [Anaerolineae bacterium]
MTEQHIKRILRFLGVDQHPPSLNAIDELLTAYTRKISWESISRIHRKSTTPDHPYLLPEAFWQSVMTNGTGGTCYESNYTFFTLLKALGYEGYLTINNMGEQVGCHSAITLMIDESWYLVDVGMPFHVAVPINPTQKTERCGQFHVYCVTPNGDNTYIVERTNHPKPYCYTLINKPVSEADYQQILINDYGDGGLFLDRGIIVKVIDDRIWRFDSSARPYQIEIFLGFSSDKLYQFLGKDLEDVAQGLSVAFGISKPIILNALQQLGA